ncbi:acyltransferase [Oscillochloris sp. ZM17-4]|uniref:acyltransferase n=1 Tax=Oscillochloris sp. ZM17-4 TaxID=2866714 RepID=UPI001C73C4FA|nr:acyltransferase [Oscillochloris sp. ZM17-4]MBX0330762.1 acyltransferase [Oscillochloris sp. ZM17-4]
MPDYLHSLAERTIQTLKGDRGYRIDPALSGRSFLQVLSYRLAALARGALRRPWIGGGGPLFLGPRVRLRHPQLISIGRSCIIEEQVLIDALSREGVRLGNNVTVARGSIIQCTGVIQNLGTGVSIGDNSAVGSFSFLGGQGGIRIGQHVIMGPRVSIHSENHRYDDVTRPIRLQGESRAGVTIGDDCWVGTGAIILDGVRVGRGCVIAAGSVVTRDIADDSVVAGVPARVIRSRRPTEDTTQEQDS